MKRVIKNVTEQQADSILALGDAKGFGARSHRSDEFLVAAVRKLASAKPSDKAAKAIIAQVRAYEPLYDVFVDFDLTKAQKKSLTNLILNF
jgi:hypothetical protein